MHEKMTEEKKPVIAIILIAAAVFAIGIAITIAVLSVKRDNDIIAYVKGNFGSYLTRQTDAAQMSPELNEMLSDADVVSVSYLQDKNAVNVSFTLPDPDLSNRRNYSVNLPVYSNGFSRTLDFGSSELNSIIESYCNEHGYKAEALISEAKLNDALSAALIAEADDTGNGQNTQPVPEIEEMSAELPYLIYVSKDSFTIAILGLDEKGEYTEVLHTFPTAVGRTSAMTRPGNYTVTSRERWHEWESGNVSPYATAHSGGLFFHGPSFREEDANTLIVRTYNEIGTRATSGCMRTTTGAAAWIYDNCPDGTPIIIANDSLYTSTPIQKLDSSQNYDPTDPQVKTD